MKSLWPSKRLNFILRSYQDARTIVVMIIAVLLHAFQYIFFLRKILSVSTTSSHSGMVATWYWLLSKNSRYQMAAPSQYLLLKICLSVTVKDAVFLCTMLAGN